MTAGLCPSDLTCPGSASSQRKAMRELFANGVVIMSGEPDLPDKLGGLGLLHLPLVGRGTFGTILPVALRNVRSEDRQVVYGLEFGPLLAHQTRKLEAVLEAMNDPD